MKKTFALVVALATTPLFAQTPAVPAPASNIQTSGSVTVGAQQVDNSSNSSKFTEYRDRRDDVLLPALTFSLIDPATGGYFSLLGQNVSRNDQTLAARIGRAGSWSLDASWAGTPHNFSNKAMTPYIQTSPGVLSVPATIPITFKKLATGAADTQGVLNSDALIAAYQSTFLAPTPLAMQTNVGRFAFNMNATDAFRA